MTTASTTPPAKKAATKKASPQTSTGKGAAKTAVRKPASKPAATKGAAKKAPSKAAKATAKKSDAVSAKATARKTTPAKAPAGAATVGERLAGRKAAKAKSLVVARGEEAWSKAELAEVRTELESELARLTSELEMAEQDLFELVSSSQGSQGDEADAGSFSSERQHEMTVAQNSRTLLLQTTNALGRIADGSYGRCESCDQAIGKMRLQAFPRATLCMPCKQHQERH